MAIEEKKKRPDTARQQDRSPRHRPIDPDLQLLQLLLGDWFTEVRSMGE